MCGPALRSLKSMKMSFCSREEAFPAQEADGFRYSAVGILQSCREETVLLIYGYENETEAFYKSGTKRGTEKVFVLCCFFTLLPDKSALQIVSMMKGGKKH